MNDDACDCGKPHVHRPEPGWRTDLCGFRLHDETATQCPNPAVAHIGATYPTQTIEILACDTHLPVARQVGQIVGEHRYSALCEHPNARWGFSADGTRSWCTVTVDVRTAPGGSS